MIMANINIILGILITVFFKTVHLLVESLLSLANSMGPDQIRQGIRPDLGPNGLTSLLALADSMGPDQTGCLA